MSRLLSGTCSPARSLRGRSYGTRSGRLHRPSDGAEADGEAARGALEGGFGADLTVVFTKMKSVGSVMHRCGRLVSRRLADLDGKRARPGRTFKSLLVNGHAAC